MNHVSFESCVRVGRVRGHRPPLADGRLGPAQALGELVQAAATVGIVERIGELDGRVLGRRPAARHRGRILLEQIDLARPVCHRSPNNPPLWSLKTPHLDS